MEETLQRRLDVMTRLVRISGALNSTLDYKPLLQLIIDSAADLLDSERASVLLLDEHTFDLRFAASTGSDEAILQRIVVPLDQSIAGAVFRDNAPQIVADLTGDPRHYRTVGEATGFQPLSLLAVPMRVKDRVVGVLEAVNKRSGEFGETDVEILSILADHAAVAIHNARMLEELRGAYHKLGDLDRLKSAFISIAGHELRTPLLVILGYADLLRKGAEGEAKDLSRKLLNAAVQLRNLVEDLTQLSYIDTGVAPERRELVDLREVVIDAGADIVAITFAKSQQLLVETGDDPLWVRIDRKRITLALTKLLANAIGFSPAGGEIRVSCVHRGDEAWVQVEDCGPGIPAGQEEAIFERFHQLENHLTRKHGGMGLGLSIVRGTAQFHGGRSWVENLDPGPGSRFTIALPIADESVP